MQDITRPRATHQLPLTRNHLYAMGALSLALALLAFFVGFSLGRGQAAAPAPAPVARFVPEEVRSGDLETLLARVEEAKAADVALQFPSELPKTDPPPVATTVDPAGGGVVGGATPPPQEAEVEAADLFPAEPRPGGASVSGAPVVSPVVGDGVPTGGWAVQVGEYAAEGDAARNVETLRAAGLEAYRVIALVGGETVWRVRVGGYGSKEKATAAAPAVASKSGASSVTVTPAP